MGKTEINYKRYIATSGRLGESILHQPSSTVRQCTAQLYCFKSFLFERRSPFWIWSAV